MQHKLLNYFVTKKKYNIFNQNEQPDISIMQYNLLISFVTENKIFSIKKTGI